MSNSNNLPKAISHKKLSHLLSNAPKDKYSQHISSEIYDSEAEKILQAINTWEESTKNLIYQISEIKQKSLKNKSSNALIALGAMEAHLNMAMQALGAFKNDQN